MVVRRDHTDARARAVDIDHFPRSILKRALLNSITSSVRIRAQLFDAGALNSNKAKPYDAYDLNGDGEGKVKETKAKDDTYCFKLKDVKFVGLDGEFDDEDDGDYEMESR